jgi:hypothetical protein
MQLVDTMRTPPYIFHPTNLVRFVEAKALH